MSQQKIKWSLLLMLDIGLFLGGLCSASLVLNLIVIGLSVVIYKYGNPILFETWYQKREKRVQESQKIRTALYQVRQTRSSARKSSRQTKK